jgi:hypothetical protein
VDIGATGLLAEAPALAKIETAFEVRPAVVIAQEVTQRADGVHRVDETCAITDLLSELLRPGAPGAGRHSVLDVQCEHRAIGIGESKLMSRSQRLEDLQRRPSGRGRLWDPAEAAEVR